MSDTDKATVRSFFEKLWSNHNPDGIDDVIDADCDGDICYPRPGDSLSSAVEASLPLTPPCMPTVFFSISVSAGELCKNPWSLNNRRAG
jgi:hypothetical protein